MSVTQTEKTVGELVVERPSRSRVFQAFGIDFCCNGKRPLSEACEKKGLSVEAVQKELDMADAAAEHEDTADYAAMPLDALAEHIVSTHHAYLESELPRLEQMAKKVAAVHGESDSRLGEIERVLNALAAELSAHMRKEEMILFPVIAEMASTRSLPSMPFGTLANPIRAMEAEHDGAGDGLEQLRILTDEYTPPEWACNTFRALFAGLHELEVDMHMHVHKENNILFPQAMRMENRLAESA